MTPIQSAIAFVRQSVQEPALAHPTLPTAIKEKVKNASRWLPQCRRVGDLLADLQRFREGGHDDTYRAMKDRGLLTFEDIVGEFDARFGAWGKGRLTPDSFVIGQQCSAHDILIFAGTYDTRAGGMFL